ncbi:phosphatase PAP2/LCP family protein [Enterococcus hermanniensis]|uniref:Phosphatidic acid phosphatase type 2/haloperoxidase domain-containing protein n=1 Tax=Enterococcus hermanniensis TaxID=249189 RepID=A0A1L8TLI1_9ENTE|nr:phosphatase PAP2/LCP family protein [Enterococcus hermanniensis]OJG45199.1 hypothetical protein RV04_GL002247 [Enterococcus hermanniensis]
MRKKYFLTSSVALIALLGLSIAVTIDAHWLQGMDHFFINHRIPNISVVTTVVGWVAKIATIGPILVLFSLYSLYLLKIKQNRLIIWGFLNLFFVSAVGYVLKHLIQRTRPEQLQYITRNSYSFPSGHSLLVTTLICSFLVIAVFLEKRVSKGLKLGLGLFALLIMGGRIYLGVHYISDVLAGIFLAVGVTLGTAALFYRYLLSFPSDSRRSRTSIFSTWQKILLGSLVLLLTFVSGISVFALKLHHSSQKMADSMYAPIEGTRKTKAPEASEPMSILILGIANDSKRQTDYRANTIMVATLNNETKKTTLTSIPRDSYTEIVGADYEDKINHAHSIGGPEMIMDSVENMLDIPLHHYVSVNMDGLETLVDAVGGVTVDNDFAFSAEGINYPKGKQHLNGWEALQYSRMRYEDPTGDYGRQGRQREVIELLVDKILSPKSLFNYQKILDSIGENGKTDLTFDQMQQILKSYRSALKQIDSEQLQGEGFTGDGYTGEEGISYQRVPQDELDRVKKLLHEQLNL